MRRGLVLAVALAISNSAIAADPNFASESFLAPYVIIIKGVYLKNDSGEWIKVIEPDRRVDLSQEEAAVTFFNNAGRVPAGSYKNFRVDFFSAEDPACLPDRQGSARRLSSKNDLEKAVMVNKGSFIRVAFDLQLDKTIAVQSADLAVGEDARKFLADSLSLEV